MMMSLILNGFVLRFGGVAFFRGKRIARPAEIVVWVQFSVLDPPSVA